MADPLAWQVTTVAQHLTYLQTRFNKYNTWNIQYECGYCCVNASVEVTHKAGTDWHEYTGYSEGNQCYGHAVIISRIYVNGNDFMYVRHAVYTIW